MYPASYSYVIGVMAYDENNKFASFSNWDYKPNANAEYEVVAPGVSVYSTLPNGRYASWNGTSMAAPMASAEAAILRSSLKRQRYIFIKIYNGAVSGSHRGHNNLLQ